MNSNYVGSTIQGGLAFPVFAEVAKAYGLKVVKIDKNTQMESQLEQVFTHEGPVLCDVKVNSEHRVIPQVKYSRPNEDSEPLLPRPEFLKNMIIEPLAVSMEAQP